MQDDKVTVRLMKADDFDAIVKIDHKVLKVSRPEYYEMKFEKLLESKDYLPTSLVAEREDGTIVGFVMGELYLGEYGIATDGATLDTIGVDPDCQHDGIGKLLVDEFILHLHKLGVNRVNTLISWNDANLIHFFSSNKFVPSRIINLERSV